MKCIICENSVLTKTPIDENLDGFICKECGGIWIQAKAYWKWIKSHGHILPEKPVSEAANLTVSEAPEIKICPDCGHFLTKRKVGHGISFHIDRCQSCGGIWLDKNEWEILKSRNLHDEIHFMFSREWQEEVANKKKCEMYEKKVEDIIGREDYKRVREFTERYNYFSRRDVILAYLKFHFSKEK